AIEDATGLPVFGGVPRSERITIPERHLGLMPAGERGALEPLVAALADLIAETCDLDALLALAQQAPPLAIVPDIVEQAESWAISKSSGGTRPVIAVARDRAFSFYYEDNLDLLRLAGAEIVPFSPMADTKLPGGTAGIYIGGGFPEVYAAELAANEP